MEIQNEIMEVQKEISHLVLRGLSCWKLMGFFLFRRRLMGPIFSVIHCPECFIYLFISLKLKKRGKKH